MPTAFLNFPPLDLADANSVRARFDTDATAGLDPTDPRYPDLTVGGMYWDCTQPGVLEAVRLWGGFTEAVAALFPGTAWGEYLDLHGETINLPRKDEVAANGEVLFAGPLGTLIAAGTVVSTQVLDPSSGQTPVEFETQNSITLVVTPGPTNLIATPFSSGGVLAAGTYYHRVTAIGGTGETIASNEAYATVAGATSRIELSWAAVAGATAYKIYRGTVAGGETLLGQVLAPHKGAPTGLVATPSALGGTLAAGSRFYKVTALDAAGESIASTEATCVVPAGGTGSVVLTWTGVVGAASYRVYYSTTTGTEAHWLPAAAGVTTITDIGTAGTAASPPGADTTSPIEATITGRFVTGAAAVPTNRALVVATVAGSEGNVPAGTVVLVVSPVNGGPSVTNDAAMSSGADVESDDAYRARILLNYGQAQGAGNEADYEQWALAFGPIGFATVQPLWAGAGTVRVIVTDQSNQPVSALVVQQLQNLLDPVPGQGAGLAPIGAIVTVATPTLLTVAVTGTVVFDDGYSLDGAAGTIPSRQSIMDSIDEYVNSLAPGGDVILNNVIARFFLIPGVLDVSAVMLNGSASNVAVGTLQVAVSSPEPVLS
jgi:uncharacterized phage protein gp47/JayE